MSELNKILLDVEKGFTSADTAEAIILDLIANQSKWISVEDRLPDVNDTFEYLVFTRSGYICYSTYIYNTEYKRNQFIDITSWDDVCGSLEIDNVTHWQPLPTAP